MLTFKSFLEEKKANYIDAIWQELGIDRNALPDTISTGAMELPEEGLYFNTAMWQIIKPIDEHDMFVRIKYLNPNSSNPNFVRVYKKKHDGKYEPYYGDVSGSVHLITIQKLAELLGLPLKASASGAGLGMPGGIQ